MLAPSPPTGHSSTPAVKGAANLNQDGAGDDQRKPGARSRSRSTITDVARVSGTSIKTVSRVFNDEPFVRPAMRERVLKAAAELDYHPNLAARSLAGRRSFLLGLFYEPPSPNYIINLQTGALDRLASERYRLLLFPCNAEGQNGPRLAALARASGLDGLILAPPMCDNAEITAHLIEAGLAFVRIGATHDPQLSPAMAMDDVAAAAEITRHLLDLGHRRIGFVAGESTHPSGTARAAGFRQAMDAAGIAPDAALVLPGHYTFDGGHAAGRQLLALPEPPTAVFASNDDMAAGVLMAANEARLVLPAQLSVVGFDDSLVARTVWPRLTTIRQPTTEMAHAATGALIALIDGGTPESQLAMPYQLILRDSTAPPS